MPGDAEESARKRTLEQVLGLKTTADDILKSRNNLTKQTAYLRAAPIYTKAILLIGNLDDVLRIKLLGNRSLCYSKEGFHRTCIKDCDELLHLFATNRATLPESVKTIEAKALWRKAESYKLLARHAEAQPSFSAYIDLGMDIVDPISVNLLQLDIQAKALGPNSSTLYHPTLAAMDALLKAVEHRGVIIDRTIRDKFPYQARIAEPENNRPEAIIDWDYSLQPRPANESDIWSWPVTTPLIFPLRVHAVEVGDETNIINPQEHDTIDHLLLNAWVKVVEGWGRLGYMEREDAEIVAPQYDDSKLNKLIVLTYHGRCFVVPRNMKYGEMIRACRWPKEPGLRELEDLCPLPRLDPNCEDGIDFHNGRVDIYAVLNQNVDGFIQQQVEITKRLHRI